MLFGHMQAPAPNKTVLTACCAPSLESLSRRARPAFSCGVPWQACPSAESLCYELLVRSSKGNALAAAFIAFGVEDCGDTVSWIPFRRREECRFNVAQARGVDYADGASLAPNICRQPALLSSSLGLLPLVRGSSLSSLRE